ncbi:unnamed protein product [Chrysoparadoxa australica]
MVTRLHQAITLLLLLLVPSCPALVMQSSIRTWTSCSSVAWATKPLTSCRRGEGVQMMATCRNCKQQFDPTADGGEEACKYHPGNFTGRLNRVNDIDTSGLEYFWSCCGAEAKDAPGCVSGKHWKKCYHYSFTDAHTPSLFCGSRTPATTNWWTWGYKTVASDADR